MRSGLNTSLLAIIAPDISAQPASSRLRELIASHDFAGMEQLFRAFFASIPHQWHAKNDIARYEGFCASVFYSHFTAAGLEVVAEESTSHGRSDMAVRHDGGVCVFEFKTGASARAAIAQAERRRYADKYRGLGGPVHLVGVAFSDEQRNIAGFEVVEAAGLGRGEVD